MWPMNVRKFLKSFVYAAAGVWHAFLTQRNMRVHCVAALLVLGLAVYLKIETTGLLFLIFSITLVIMAEMLNTAVEAVVDLCVQTYHPLARIAKNVAAGAVLVTALSSIVVAYLVLWPRLWGH